MQVVSVQQMRDLEQAANAAGHSYADMMERAGRSVAQAIAEQLDVAGLKAVALIGPGNNGGDGLVCARYLAEMGAQVLVYIWKRDIEDDTNLQLVREREIPVTWSEADEGFRELKLALSDCDLVVDGLLGTGVTRPIEGTLKELLLAVAEALSAADTAEPLLTTPAWPQDTSIGRPWVVAVDVPSGVNCDTGAADPVTLKADLTVTFAFPKLGQLIFPGAGYLGQLVVADIGISRELAKDITTLLATPKEVARLLPPRPQNGHKGTFGKVMVVAGSANYVGAAYLCSNAAARVGAGLVTLAIPSMLHGVLATKSNVTTYLVMPDDRGSFTPDGVRLLRENWEGYGTLLLGPGMGHGAPTTRFVSELLGLHNGGEPHRIGFLRESAEAEDESAPPSQMVIDADGLNILAGIDEWWKGFRGAAVLTPHPGEMARLLHSTVEEVEQDRLATARKAAQLFGQVVVFKGAYTIVANPAGEATINPFANPALASAGTGDVLAGTIAGLLAQGAEPYAAAVAGAYVHGLAGELVSQEVGDAGVLASDLLAKLPLALQALRG